MRITDIIKDSSGKDKDRKNEDVSFVEINRVDIEEEEQKRQRANKLYDRAVYELTNISRAVRDDKIFNINNLLKVDGEFVDSLLSTHHLFLQALYREVKNWDLPVHSVNTAIIAFKIGLGLKYDRKALNALILIAFLHDLGMLIVPQELRNKPGKLTGEEYEVVKRHPLKTYKILKGLDDKYSMIGKIAHQEHEREDGSGYPRGLKGDEIHKYAKVIGLADIYCAMVHPRPQRKRFLPFEAVKQIIAVFKGSFPVDIMKAMINELSAFPVGIYVKLNTKEIGRVVATNRLAPLRPTVEILVNPTGQRLKELKYLDLSQHHLIGITEAFFKEDER
ncbi:MAG: HD-GYP domain-containing protein [Thermodesulfobacteriota bacterium]